MARRRSYHHGDARAALTEVAVDLVDEAGGADISLREAARRVGIDPAACYRHFRSREELLLAVSKAGFHGLAEHMSAAIAATKTGGPERIIAIGRAYVRFAVLHPGRFRVMFGESGTHARDVRARPDLERSPYETLEAALQEWAARRRRSVDLEQLALLLWAGVHGIARLVIDGALDLTEETMDQAVEDIARRIMQRPRT